MGAPQPAPGRRRTVVVGSGLLLVLGLLLLGLALLGQSPAPPQAPRASPVASDAGGAPAPATPPTGTDGDTAGQEETPTSEEATGTAQESGAEDGSAAMDASEPTRVRLPDQDIDAEVFPIALAEDGTLPAPRGERAHDAAWFEGSPTPGEEGPAVIEGHVTYSGEPSVFFELGDVGAGDRIEVDRADGSTAVFAVERVQRVPKDEFPTWEVYGNTEGPELRLITCGGEVDASGRHQDNVLVHARLVGTRGT